MIQIGKNSMAATLTENGKMAGNFTEDNSPIPPVLNTPGVKQVDASRSFLILFVQVLSELAM